MTEADEGPQIFAMLRGAAKVTGLVILVVALVMVPVWHYLAWTSEQEAARCLATGQVTRVTRAADVRVTTSIDDARSGHVVVNSVSIRLSGRWRKVQRPEEGYRDQDWYTGSGSFEPLPRTAAYPPLVVRNCADPNGVMFEDDAQRVAHSEALASWWRWTLDAASAVLLVGAWLRVRSRAQRQRR